MIFKDPIGNVISEKDLVVLNPGSVVGQIVGTDSGLAPNSQPTIVVQVILPMVAAPNGVVGSVIKAAKPESPLS